MKLISIFHKALLEIPGFTLTIPGFHPPAVPLKNGISSHLYASMVVEPSGIADFSR
jgi:hypothetical protein